jgi:hypothetical protein
VPGNGNWVLTGLFFIDKELLWLGTHSSINSKERREMGMRKRVSLFLAVAILAICFFGCTGISEDTQVKCPKCGAIFTVDEGLEGVRIGQPQAPK